MKAKKKTLFACLMGLTMMAGVGLSACGENGNSDSGSVTSESVHTHTFADTWEYDDTYHWHPATCEHTDEQGDKTEHTFEGNTCTVCGYEHVPSTPEIRLIGTENLNVVQSRVLASIGTIACTLDGKPMSSEDYTIVDETDPEAVITGTTFQSDVWGKHTIRVTATNPEDSTKTATTTFTINVYRKLLEDAALSNVTQTEIIGDADNPQESQKIEMLEQKSNYIGVLYMEPSEYYYAEAIIDGLQGTDAGQDWLGMAHIARCNEAGVDTGTARWLGSAMHVTGDIGSGDMNGWVGGRHVLNTVVDSVNWDSDFKKNTSMVYRQMNGNTVKQYEGTVATEEHPTFKYAIARVGELFYTFVNDEFVGVYSNDYYAAIPTIPAFWSRLHNMQTLDGWDGITITGIDFFGGEEDVSAKVGELIGKNGGLSAWGASFADDCVANGYVTLGETSAEKGVNFTVNKNTGWTNNAAVALNAAFAGEFTLEYDYKPVGDPNLQPNGQPYTADAFVDFRTANWSSVALSVGAQQGMNATLSGFFANLGEKFDNVIAPEGFDLTAGYHCKITRQIDETNSKSVYTITFTSLADSSKVITRTLEDTSAAWNATLFPVLKTRAGMGEWFNIAYSGSAKVSA